MSVVVRICAGNYRVKMHGKYYVILNWKYGWEVWKLDADSDLCLSVVDWQQAYPKSDSIRAFKTLREALHFLELRKR